MQQFLQDLRFTFRMIWKKPLFFLVVILTLALGIGANTAIFSIVNGVVLEPLPYKDSDRILTLAEERKSDKSRAWARIANYLDWDEQENVFEHLGHFKPENFTLSSEDGLEIIAGAATSANFFDVLGVGAQLGRVFQPEEEQPGAEPVVILGHDIFKTRFGADRSWLGRTITLDATAHTIIGVMPPGFRFSYKGEQDIWTAKVFSEKERADRLNYLIMPIGRLKAGISLAEAQADMDRFTPVLEELYPRENEGWGIWLQSLKEGIVGKVSFTLLVLLGCVTVVLLIACANVVNLLLSHSTMREREFALRVVLGAGRGRLVRHFLTESLTLSSLGALGGLLFVVLSTKLLVVLDPGGVPRLDDVEIDTRVLAFTLVITLLVTVVLGLVTSFKSFRMNLTENIKQGVVLATKEVGIFRLRNLVVAIEVGLVLSLLVFGALALESYRKLSEIDPGFIEDGRFTFNVPLPRTKYPHQDAVVPFFTELQEKLNALPGVESSAATTNIPLGGTAWGASYIVAGYMPTDVRLPRAMFDYISTDYFRTMGIPLLTGRRFTEADRQGAPDVVILNEAMATRHWTVDEALGQFLYINNREFEVVGIVGNVKYRETTNMGWAEKFYRPNLQMDYAYPARQVVVWTRTVNPESLIPSVRNSVLEIDSGQPINKIRLLEDLVNDANARHRFNMVLFLIFGLIGLFLGAVGVYGVVNYSVGRRTREMGIRMAFGARKSDVLKLVIGTEMIPVLVGVALGIGTSLALSQTVSSLLYDASTSDPVFYAGVSCLLLAVAILAIYFPALRASRVDPVQSIRYE